jgi:hypothetical protein
VYLYIVIVGRKAFFAFSSVWNERGIKKWGKMWKVETLQVEEDLNLQKMPKPISIPKKSTRKRGSCHILCLHSCIMCSKSF